MIKHMEDLLLDHKTREAARHRRIHYRHAAGIQRRGLFPAQESGPAARPRIRFDSDAPDIKQDPPKLPMRVLLRHARTMKYVQSGERWTKNPKQARDFRNGWWATIHAFAMNPRHLVIEYEFDDDRYNLNIPFLGPSPT